MKRSASNKKVILISGIMLAGYLFWEIIEHLIGLSTGSESWSLKGAIVYLLLHPVAVAILLLQALPDLQVKPKSLNESKE